MSFVILQTLIHIELMFQDELFCPLEKSKDLNPEYVQEIYDGLLYCSHLTLGATNASESDDYYEIYDLNEIDSEKFTAYVSIFNDLVLNREGGKLAKTALQIHPILLVQQESDFSEFDVLSGLVQELRDMMLFLTDPQMFEINLKSLEIDGVLEDKNRDTWLCNINGLQNHEKCRMFAIFEQRLEFLAQKINEHDIINHRE